MNPPRDPLRVQSLTVLQMMKLVVLGSVASTALAFGSRLSEEGVGRVSPWLIPIVEALFIPLGLAVVAFPLLKKGQLKDWFILAMVAFSVSVALGVGILATVEDIRRGMGGRRQPPMTSSALGTIAVIFAILGLALAYFSRRLIPGRCPDCRRWRLLPEARFRVRPRAGRGRVYQCLLCRGQFLKARGRWEAIPAEPSPAE